MGLLTTMYSWYQGLPLAKRFVVACFIIWVLQAVPKWGFVIFSDGETTGSFLRVFITPRTP